MKTFEECLDDVLQTEFANPLTTIDKLRGRAYMSLESFVERAAKDYAEQQMLKVLEDIALEFNDNPKLNEFIANYNVKSHE